jgi:uncharacterized protein (DUF4415 family)
MTAKKYSSRRDWRDKDDAPDLSRSKWRDALVSAPVLAGDRVVKRGRPVSSSPKISTTVRLDADILEHFRAAGRGWQTRLNAALRRAAGL